MRNISIAFFVSTLLFVSPIMAGSGHEHGPNGGHSHGPISNEAVFKKANQQIN